jgi:hypothetical protein
VKHTPGPWSVVGPSKPDNTGGRDYAILAQQKIIAEAYERVGPNDDRPAYENALLIAAAPDLLAAAFSSVAAANIQIYVGVFDPLDSVLGWAAGKVLDWTSSNWNNSQYWGNACSTNSCPIDPTGGGGGGAW